MNGIVLVYGFYGKHNLGDELFKKAFSTLFPKATFTFTDHITEKLVNAASAVIIGGGSLLDGALSCDPYARLVLATKPVFYVGVGGETDIHDDHKSLLSGAKLVAERNGRLIGNSIDISKSRYLTIPDLVYSLESVPSTPAAKTVLVLPNFEVLSGKNEPHWKRAAWEYFRSEFSQLLDELIEDGYTVDFLPMSNNRARHDHFASAEITALMEQKDWSRLRDFESRTYEGVLATFSKYSVVITQRYHGIVLADLAGVPCVPIYHHDKLVDSRGISYYGIIKRSFRGAFDSTCARSLAVDFSELQSCMAEELDKCAT